MKVQSFPIKNSFKITTLLLGVLAIMVLLTITFILGISKRNGEENVITFSTIDTSTYISFWKHDKEDIYTINDSSELEILFEYSGNRPLFDKLKESLSQIDFSNNSLIAVFSGVRPAGEYNLRTLKVIEGKNKLLVYLEEISPGESCTQTSVLTYPNALIVIPKTNKIVDTVVTQSVKECK